MGKCITKRIMKHIFLLLVLAFSGYAFAADTDKSEADTKPLMCQDIDSKQIARSGCCSHHQGVCGCSGGRNVCCDGTFSPSCTCMKEDPPIVTN